MTSQLVVGGSLALVVVILASILGAVERRERFVYVGGIALFILAHTVVSPQVGVATTLAVVGILLAAASTIPMLRESV